MKLRVLYIDHTIHKSGAAISLGTLVKNLSLWVEPHFILRTGSEVEEIIGASDKPIYFERLLSQFMTTLRTPQYSLLLFIWHLFKVPIALIKTFVLVRKWKIQIIHLNESALLPYVFIARLQNIPVVMHARGATAPRPIEQFFFRLLGYLKKVAVIAIDEETKLSLPQKCREITQIVYNPVDLGPVPSKDEIDHMRKAWGCSANDVVIGQLASLHSSKGIWKIIDYAKILCKEYPYVYFVFVGDDRPGIGEGPKLRQVIAEQGLKGRVILTGYRSDIALVYASLDIVLCLFSENLGGVGRTAFEAAIAGKPLIATLPDPDKSETIKNGVTGLVYKPNDDAGVLAGLDLLIKNEDERKLLGDRAKTAIGNRHFPINTASKVLSIYKSIMQANKE